MNIRRRQCRSVGAVCIGQVLILGLALPRTLLQEPPPLALDGWVGGRVVQKVAKLILRVNDEPVETNLNAPRFYKVEQVDGALVLLKPVGPRTKRLGRCRPGDSRPRLTRLLQPKSQGRFEGFVCICDARAAESGQERA